MSKPNSPGATPAAVRALVTGLVDYAGLFPPAKHAMADAMTNYARYVRGPHSWMLGRFVVPVARLEEFDAASARLLPSGDGSLPWRLAALAGDDFESDVQAALSFNCRHWHGSELGHAVIDTIELRAEDPGMVERARAPEFFALYVESATPKISPALLDAIQRRGARAKIRTGGVTADAFPPADAVIAFLSGCAERSLAFKATAGLHHMIRSEYSLTYEAGSQHAPMYGFLNVFLAAAAVYSGMPSHDAQEILVEPNLEAFRFEDAGITWRDRTISTDDIARIRGFATSFGSCSFREPVDELIEAELI